jgi:hypothetical protein
MAAANAGIALGIEALADKERILVQAVTLRPNRKQLTANAGFLAHLASQRLTVVVKLSHGHHLSHHN